MAIFVESPFAPLATGTGTAISGTGTITIPSSARELVSARVHVNATNGVPAESITGVVAFAGQDWKHVPYEFFSEIGGSKVGAVDQLSYFLEPRWWKAHLPVKPGGTFTATWEGLDGLAADGDWFIDIKWSSEPTGALPRQRLCSRETATTTTTGPTLTITGASRLIEYTVAVSTSTVAADDPSAGRITVTTGATDIQQQMSLGYNLGTVEATSGVEATSLMHAEVDLPVARDPMIITSALSETVALGTAGQWAYSIGYVPTLLNRA